LLQTE